MTGMASVVDSVRESSWHSSLSWSLRSEKVSIVIVVVESHQHALEHIHAVVRLWNRQSRRRRKGVNEHDGAACSPRVAGAGAGAGGKDEKKEGEGLESSWMMVHFDSHPDLACPGQHVPAAACFVPRKQWCKVSDDLPQKRENSNCGTSELTRVEPPSEGTHEESIDYGLVHVGPKVQDDKCNKTTLHHSHGDAVINDGIGSENTDGKNMYELLDSSPTGIAEWILPLVLAGGLRTVHWIKNSWSKQFLPGSYRYQVGAWIPPSFIPQSHHLPNQNNQTLNITSFLDLPDQALIKVDLCHPYYYDDDSVVPTHELSLPKPLHLIVSQLVPPKEKNVDPAVSSSSTTTNEHLLMIAVDNQKSNNDDKVTKPDSPLTKHNFWILDICLDYFACLNPFLTDLEALDINFAHALLNAVNNTNFRRFFSIKQDSCLHDENQTTTHHCREQERRRSQDHASRVLSSSSDISTATVTNQTTNDKASYNTQEEITTHDKDHDADDEHLRYINNNMYAIEMRKFHHLMKELLSAELLYRNDRNESATAINVDRNIDGNHYDSNTTERHAECLSFKNEHGRMVGDDKSFTDTNSNSRNETRNHGQSYFCHDAEKSGVETSTGATQKSRRRRRLLLQQEKYDQLYRFYPSRKKGQSYIESLENALLHSRDSKTLAKMAIDALPNLTMPHQPLVSDAVVKDEQHDGRNIKSKPSSQHEKDQVTLESALDRVEIMGDALIKGEWGRCDNHAQQHNSPPLLVTVARSKDDGFTPPSMVESLQLAVLEKMHGVYCGCCNFSLPGNGLLAHDENVGITIKKSDANASPSTAEQCKCKVIFDYGEWEGSTTIG